MERVLVRAQQLRDTAVRPLDRRTDLVVHQPARLGSDAVERPTRLLRLQHRDRTHRLAHAPAPDHVALQLVDAPMSSPCGDGVTSGKVISSATRPPSATSIDASR